MDLLTRCLALLLPLCCRSESDSEVTLVKTIRSKADVTPVCTSSALVTLIVCKIKTKGSGEECRLFYQYEEESAQECDSRFTLVSENQTVFLHLIGLTPGDSGSYTCECSRLDGTYFLNLTVTVEETEDTSRSSEIRTVAFLIVSICVTAVIIIIGVTLGLTYRPRCNGKCLKSAASGQSGHQTPGSVSKDDQDDLYTCLQQPASDLYQTISNPARHTVAAHSDAQEKRLKKAGSKVHRL